ncbi:RNA polymerase sigma factor [Algibacter sp. Ld11]|uniref:RNA polymerase sigma factor n=1 Tax=Algibacter sp. Ld11 TaxID=649150 RepID=UPI003868DAA2
MHTISDNYLLDRIKQDDYDAFNQLYNTYWEELYLYAYRLTGDKENAFLIIQDLFVMLWDKRQTHKITSLKSYLFQCVKYQFFKQYKKARVNLETLTNELENFVFNNFEETNPEILDLLGKGLDELPEKRREILIMNKYQNMSAQEISDTLNISIQTVRNQLSSALIQLRSFFSKNIKDIELVIFLLFYFK